MNCKKNVLFSIISEYDDGYTISIVMFVFLDCSLVHNRCVECIGEGAHDCFSCSYGRSIRTVTDGSCFGKKER